MGGPRPRQERPHLQVVGDAQPGEDAPALRHVGDAARHDLVGGAAVEQLALEGDGAGARGHEPGDDAHQRGLAGPVRPDDGDGLAGLDAKADIPEGGELPVARAHRVERQHLRRGPAAFSQILQNLLECGGKAPLFVVCRNNDRYRPRAEMSVGQHRL